MNLNATVINEKGYTNKEVNERRGKRQKPDNVTKRLSRIKRSVNRSKSGDDTQDVEADYDKQKRAMESKQKRKEQISEYRNEIPEKEKLKIHNVQNQKL